MLQAGRRRFQIDVRKIAVYLQRYFVEFLVISTLGYLTLPRGLTVLSLPAAFPGFVPAPPVAWVAAPAGAQCWMWLSFAFGDDARCPGFWRSRAGLPQMVASPQVVSPEGVFPGTARVVIVGVCTCPPTELIRWAARRVGSRVPVD